MENTTFVHLNEKRRRQRGMSLIELIIVLAVGTIMSLAVVFSFSSAGKYAVDTQALKIIDVLQEARQRAINQKAVIRVEFNQTQNQIRLIDENAAGTSGDDVVIKTVAVDTANVKVGTKPINVSAANVPTSTSPILEAVFAQTQYTPSQGQTVFTLCFTKDGRVVQTSNDGSCLSTNTLRGATVYIYSNPDAQNVSKMIRAVTVSGVSGASALVKCKLDAAGNCASWVK